MAYEPKTWSCGETITADALNHIEDGIANADKGYECTESRQTLTEESVTTYQGQAPYASMGLSYNTLIDADVLKVTFNGTEYTCAKHDIGSGNAYGGLSPSGPAFSEYPFTVVSSPNGYGSMNVLYTETEGTYSIKIEVVDMTVETTPCFKKAVQNALPPSESDVFKVGIRLVSNEYEADKTYAEVLDAVNNGKLVYASQGGSSAWNFAGMRYVPSEHIYFTKISAELDSNPSIYEVKLNVLCYYADGSIEEISQTLYSRD